MNISTKVRAESAKLMLIPKQDKTPSNPSAYRPVCLLNKRSKLYKYIILKTLNKEAEKTKDMNQHQCVLRKNKTAYRIIEEVLEMVKTATRTRNSVH